MILSSDQKSALELMQSGHSMFMTGEAGTGKSTVVDMYVEECEANKVNVVCLAPTGIAATNIGGQTIHRFLKFKIGFLEKDDMHGCGGELAQMIKGVDVFVIDEISMVRSDMFNAIDKRLRSLDPLNRPFGGKQMILVGDFFQIAPVAKNERHLPRNEKTGNKVRKQFGSIYCFSTNNWDSLNPIVCSLTEGHRQNDRRFMKALNLIRVGKFRGAEYINSHANILDPGESAPENCVTLCARNETADGENARRLGAIEAPMTTYKAVVVGEVKESEYPKAPVTLELKVGARVMTLVNDMADRFVNGDCGTVRRLSEKSVTIDLDNGSTVMLEKKVWEIKRHNVTKSKSDNGEEKSKVGNKIVGTYKQFPLNLAWAITMHKSQGQTLSHVCVDLSDGGAFGHGQLYVALSRARTVENLYLVDKISPSDLICDQEVLDRFKIDYWPDGTKLRKLELPLELHEELEQHALELLKSRSGTEAA